VLFTFLTLWFLLRVSALIHNLFERVKKLALKLHAHSVHYAHKLVQTRRSREVFLSVLPTFKPIRRGLLACLPATLLILTDPPFSFLVRGLFFPSGFFSLIDVRSFLLLA